MPNVRVNGVEYPSVTTILADVGLTADYKAILGSKQVFYSMRGRSLHAAIQYYHEGLVKPEDGVLDEATLHPQIRPGFTAYKQFLQDTGHVAHQTELELVHEPYGFCGHLDRAGLFPQGDMELIDFKYSDSPDLAAARLQLAGYEILYRHVYPQVLVGRRYVVQLSPNGGGYRLHDVTDNQACQTFLAALLVYRAKRGRA